MRKQFRVETQLRIASMIRTPNTVKPVLCQRFYFFLFLFPLTLSTMKITILDLNVDITLYNITRTIPKTVHIVSTFCFCKFLSISESQTRQYFNPSPYCKSKKRSDPIVEFCIQLYKQYHSNRENKST